MTDNLLNRALGQYRLVEVIGRGGMATVYKAYQASLDRFVAVKVLQHNHNAEYSKRFASEARSLALLQHPNILPVHDYGAQDHLLYLVLQYVEGGRSLADLTGRPLEPAHAVLLVRRLLGGLAYAHDRGVIHRDVKPANVLMPGPDWPMLADFGLSKLLSASGSHLTTPGMIIGTMAYMAPEQVTGEPVDRRVDLYASGVMLYEFLTGRLPFEGDSPMQLLVKQAYAPLPPPRQFNPAISEALEQVLVRALAKSPDDRYQSAAEMIAALDRAAPEALSGGAAPPLTAPPHQPAPRPVSSEGLLTMRMPAPTSTPAEAAAAPAPAQPAPASPTAPPGPGGRGRALPALLALVALLAAVVAVVARPQAGSPAAPEPAAMQQEAAAVPSPAPPTAAPRPTLPPTSAPIEAPLQAVAAAPAAGVVTWRDEALWNDAVDVTVRGLPPPDPGQVYVAWLSSASGSLALGPLTPGAQGELTVSYISPVHANLLGQYDRVYITRVPEAAATAEVANVVMVGALPAEPLSHVRHAMVAYDTPPDKIGFLLGLRREVFEVLVHAERTKREVDAGRLADARKHAEHVVNVIEGQYGANYGDLNRDGRVHDPGDGFGIVPSSKQEGYIEGVLHHILVAGAAPDAPAAMRESAGQIEELSGELGQMITQARDLALRINAAQSAEEARGDAAELLRLTEEAKLGESGIITIYRLAQRMAEVTLEPVAPGTVVNAPPAVRVVALPEPETLVVVGDDTYGPGKLTIVRGTTVVWRNDGRSVHTVTAEDGSFDSGNIPPGGTFAHTFTKPEIFPYYCTLHGGRHGEGMAGTVNASDATGAGAAP